MRHTGAGLAIPDFPLMFGHLVPPYWDAKIAIHFSHRVGALVVVLSRSPPPAIPGRGSATDRSSCAPPRLLIALVAVQATLGALTVLSRLNVVLNSLTSCAARWY